MSSFPSLSSDSTIASGPKPPEVPSLTASPNDSKQEETLESEENISFSEQWNKEYEEFNKVCDEFDKQAAEVEKLFLQNNKECAESLAKCKAQAAKTKAAWKRAETACHEAFGAMTALTVVAAVRATSPPSSLPSQTQRHGSGPRRRTQGRQ